jgi:hypothetical protein
LRSKSDWSEGTLQTRLCGAATAGPDTRPAKRDGAPRLPDCPGVYAGTSGGQRHQSRIGGVKGAARLIALLASENGGSGGQIGRRMIGATQAEGGDLRPGVVAGQNLARDGRRKRRRLAGHVERLDIEPVGCRPI